MVLKKILRLPVKAVKGTVKVASFAYKTATAAVLGAAVYRGVKEARTHVSPPLGTMPKTPKPPAALKVKKKAPVKKKAKTAPAKKKKVAKKKSSKKKK